MTTEVIVAMIASGGGLLGSAIGVIASARLTNYRIGQLEEKVNKHNNLIDRVYRLEKTAELEGERIKVANHRIDVLEDLNILYRWAGLFSPFFLCHKLY